MLPEEVVGQPKRTFTLPWDVWLRGPLGVRLSQELADLAPPLLPYMNPRAVRGAWQNFVIGQTNWSRPWSLYVLNEWVRRNMTGAANHPASTAEAIHTAAAISAAASNRGRKGRESPRRMYILGINAYHGNASAAIIADGRLVAAVEEERFNRVKYAAGFPAAAIRYCLDAAGITLREVDHIAIPRNPWARLGTKLLYALRMPSFARESAKVMAQFVGIRGSAGAGI